jgi:DNA polymerase kappa
MYSSAPHEGQQGQPAAPQQQHAAWQDYQSVFTAAKAGMDGVDKDKVKKTVYEMSKDSAHFKNEQRKQALVDAKIQQLQAQAAAMSPSDLAMHHK